LHSQDSNVSGGIPLDVELLKYAVKGTEAQWEEALQNVTSSERSGKDIVTPSRVQIQTVHATSSVLKRKLDQKDIEQEAEANSKPSKKTSTSKPERRCSKGKKA
jgi:predicted nucleic acid-binding protein